jgi:hypothetical protein
MCFLMFSALVAANSVFNRKAKDDWPSQSDVLPHNTEPRPSILLCSCDSKKKTKKAKKFRPDPEVAPRVRESEVWKQAEEVAAAVGMAWVKKKRVSRRNKVQGT